MNALVPDTQETRVVFASKADSVVGQREQEKHRKTEYEKYTECIYPRCVWARESTAPAQGKALGPSHMIN